MCVPYYYQGISSSPPCRHYHRAQKPVACHQGTSVFEDRYHLYLLGALQHQFHYPVIRANL
jgi:hypothetical protein